MRLLGIDHMDTVARQKSRLMRVAMTASGIFVHMMVCWVILSLEYMNLTPVQFLGLVSVAAIGFLAFVLAIMLEWNLSFEDPDMALPQMLWASSVVIMTAFFTVDLTPVVVFSGVALIVAGANRLSRLELLAFVFYSITLYGVSIFFKAPFDSVSWINEIVSFLAFGFVLFIGPQLYRFEVGMIEDVLLDRNKALSEALRRIEDLATRDELTGVYNRRYLADILARQKALADRQDYRFSLAYVDLDFFKRVNDRFGHATGDTVLRGFADIAVKILREVDCVARIGGEEFVLVLGGTPRQDAVIAARRIGEELREMQVSGIEPAYRITASIGISEYRKGEEVGELMERADRALYDAKHTGRNQIIIAD
ncbi:MAG: GGDEF domain-containing protein [Pseudomonadales bacterium]|nr:GGDEF domain-containing protein [Pseudomonadales bacterium]